MTALMTGPLADVVTADQLIAAEGLRRSEGLPLVPQIAELLGRGVLGRSQWVLCEGQGSLSFAAMMLGAATQQGSWLAAVALPTLGAEAIAELGVDLQRVVAVDADLAVPMQWAERVVACSEGFDLVLTAVPPQMPERIWRSVAQRTRRNGTVAVGVDPDSRARGLAGVDMRCRVTGSVWRGLGRGVGRLEGRHLEVEVQARRLPGARRGRVVLW